MNLYLFLCNFLLINSSINRQSNKFASNSSSVMEAFPKDDRAKDLKDLDIGVDPSAPSAESWGELELTN